MLIEMKMDRLSNLPDKIAEAILSNLTGEDIIRLSFASKRWRKLCSRNTPFLTFHHGFDLSNFVFSRNSPFDRESWTKRVTCVNSFMNLRQSNGAPIKSFNLSWLYNAHDSFYISKWLFQVVACEVETINLDILPRTYEQNIVPLNLDLIPVFNCKTLKKLVINLSVNGCTLNSLPSLAIHLNSLQHLKLQHVCFGSKSYFDLRSIDVGELVSSSCKCLKELYLVDCWGHNLTINSSSLHLFHLYYSKPQPSCTRILYQLHIIAKNLQELDIIWYHRTTLVEICTPNLQVFNWTGYPSRDYWCVEKLTHLEQATLNFREFPPQDFKIGDVIGSISNITSLQPLCLQSVVVLARCNAIPFMFHRLKTLVLVSNGLGASEVEPLKSLLTGAPNLREFKLTSLGLPPRHNPFSDVTHPPRSVATTAASCYDVKYWERGVLQFVRQLKMLTIELYGGPFVLELFRFLLKNAQLLEKVIVYYSPPCFPQEAAAIIEEFKQDFTIITICVV